MTSRAAVAAGHPLTAEAAEQVLREGGNAFDAVIAAFFTACVAEPVLCSPGGGGFVMARGGDGDEILFDFFTQTPRRRRPPSELDFETMEVDFGSTRQSFWMGVGAAAVPGAARGIFELHRRFGSVPMTELAAPAVDLARRGVEVSEVQAHIFRLVAPIYVSRPSARRLFAGRGADGPVLRAGDHFSNPEFGDFLDSLSREGEDLFYRGEVARAIVRACRAGGCLELDDLEGYRVELRRPLAVDYRDSRVLLNPPPSAGGALIAFGLRLLAEVPMGGYGFGSEQASLALADVLGLTNLARQDATVDVDRPWPALEVLLGDPLLGRYRAMLAEHPRAYRGTTHVSVVDGAGNCAAMTVTNGEGCGEVIAGTGVMLNNMLGEEDLNPHGFHRWPENRRLSSMMAPTVTLLPDGARMVCGSGGSNRIRTAILQVLVNVIDHRLDLATAIEAPRMHREPDRLYLEGGLAEAVMAALTERCPDPVTWPGRSFFFGGVHSVLAGRDGAVGWGDSRRGGAWAAV